MTKRVGIEKIGVYPCTLALTMSDLCAARGTDPEHVRNSLMVDERSLNPIWEDPVTNAVNAALTVIDEADKETIELLIVASESGVDQEKPLSTWVHRYLGLRPNCRNFEVKHACYGGSAGLQMAAHWLAWGSRPSAKALVISTDQSRAHLGQPWEYVLGAGAAAVLVSCEPRLVELELGSCGYWTREISDLTRPTSTVETGHRETSLLSYIEALEGAWEHFRQAVPGAELDSYFRKHVYHAPFGGMTLRAHRTLLRLAGWKDRGEIQGHFNRRCTAALSYLRRMGGTYGASVFIGLLGLLERSIDLEAGDRVSVFSYGSGCAAEMYSVRACQGAYEVADNDLEARLAARQRVTVGEYEEIELLRASLVDRGDYETETDLLGTWRRQTYVGSGRLVFLGMKDYYRRYGWS